MFASNNLKCFFKKVYPFTWNYKTVCIDNTFEKIFVSSIDGKAFSLEKFRKLDDYLLLLGILNFMLNGCLFNPVLR